MKEVSKVRIDKWLWAVRVYKTRSLAKKACESGKVKIDGETQKPSKILTGEEHIHVRKNRQDRKYRVAKLIEKRVGAPVAAECYEDLTPEEEENKRLMSAFLKVERRDPGKGRPTKKERREIDKFKDKQS